jgi:endonuclease YncB( thermonuclease family)
MKQARSWSVLLFTWTALLFAACSGSRTGIRQTESPTSSSPSLAFQARPKQRSQIASFSGQVVGIEDGDTIMVLDDANRTYKIRLQGIDAPESGQAFGERSRQNLSEEVFDKQVAIEWSKRDRYGRIVGKVRLNGRDVCLQQIKAGMAWHYKYYQAEQSPEDRKLYADAEDEARAIGRGLWADANPSPPWDFRHRR